MTGPRDRRRGRRRGGGETAPAREVDYRHLRNPFPPVPVFSEDRVGAIHDAALGVLENLGMKVLLPEARALYRAGGAVVDDASQMVRIGRDMVEAALASAPRSFTLRAGARDRDVLMELGVLTLEAGAGAPHATDLIRGRRPANLRDYRELTILTQQFDALHMLTPLVEPQDVPLNLRHYATLEAQLTLSDKFPVIFARGTPQVQDGFEMIRDFRGLSDADFAAEPWCYTIVNTNSPRQLDVPMALGLIDFARAGQMVIVTPFCLMGAMAPVTVAGALTLSHAEALAGITLTQLARPGAPVCYGAFASNVDMKSGAPAFGTPEQVRANLGAGQLARLLGLPWRCAAGCAANINDAQAAHETQMSAWGAVLAGATVVLHGAGWIEGGLSVSYEKFITDLEVLQTFAELCADMPEDDLALDALAEVAPGGHFFGCAHTMERYATAFYEPLVADWSNFGAWTEAGARDASTRATGIWQALLDNPAPLDVPPERAEALTAFIARRSAEGGAPPES
ncbi:trimethylamine methyltransferase [Roseovarius spongiae]|uniref:Methyltransferase n=1 Tax=Roseovarius spongiae TaxID=2320272 RepID=A0A3A8AWV1_9RHOB|nr:trimethylamine methyltransferase family protein [Roseovarius spongiae]RKF16156.1 trimethylamine methyltransferase [Roseovarius spongiae]